MQRRRDFLKRMGLISAAGFEVFGDGSKIGAFNSGPKSPGGPPSPDDVLKLAKMKPRGGSYEATVPDTLDLAERAGLAANALTGSADSQHNYETYHGGHLDQRPPYLSHGYGGPCMQKPVHALPMMRVMSGSSLNQDFDRKMMEAITRDIEQDGLWWLKTEGSPWRAEGFKKDFVNVSASGRFMVALADWYRYDRDSAWLAFLERMGRGLMKIAISGGDNVKFYDSFLRTGWPDLKDSPLENSQIYCNGLALRGFTHWYALSGDKQALNMAEKLADYIRRPAVGTWNPSEGPTMVAAAEHAHWEGHYHSHTMGMIGLIEYANQVNDAQLKSFVADFYEYAREFGIARMGFFPAAIGPAKQINEESKATGMPDEGCAAADMTLLAILLSDGGVGDYWDHVEQYVRNQLIEHQILRRELVEEIVAAGPAHKIDPRIETDDRVIDRQIGAFISAADPTLSYGWWTMCCLGNCSVALYKAWESIIRCYNGIAQVNLHLNRASPWIDLDSYLPYEGKVVLRNKTAQKAFVRLPVGASKQAVKCRVNQAEISLHWLNNYLLVENLAPRDVVAIEFPVRETEEAHTETAYGQQYLCRFRGHTLVDIAPRAQRPIRTSDTSDDGSQFTIVKGYPLYLRASYKSQKAPQKRVQRYVSPVII